MARFWIGTSGWNYKHWRERFYPKKLPQRRWFEHYSQHFPTVEINNSFYHEPRPATYDAWREQAPDGFCYAVKAHRFLTHYKRLIDPKDPLERVIAGVRRLEDHAGPVLYQLPPGFKRTEQTVERLEEFLAMLPRDLKHAVEFRHDSWYTDEALEQLRAHGVAYCGHDMGGADVPLVATAGFAYVRFHGPSEKKYHGDYPDATLKRYAERLRALSAGDVYCYFNNDVDGHAITNARTLAGLLDAPLAAGARKETVNV